MVSLTIVPRSRNFKKIETEADEDLLVSELLQLIANNYEVNPNRIRLTKFNETLQKQIPLKLHTTLVENGLPLTGSVELFAKDLGLQINWRTVFLIEYLGPLLIHPLFYLYKSVYSTNTFTHTQTQSLAYWLVVLHFVKREFETWSIHRFSNDTMPFTNIFKNSGHYWILSGFNLAYFIYAPQTNQETDSTIRKFLFHVNEFSSTTNFSLVALWAFAELSNLKTHIALSNIRKVDKKAYIIPFGYGFDKISCPNYFFESLAWFSYALLVGNWSSWVFLAVASGQMYIWAIKKHKRYLKTFGDDYKKLKRNIMFPYVA